MSPKTQIHIAELYELLLELGVDELRYQLENGNIVNHTNPVHMLFLSQVIDQRQCQCSIGYTREAGVVVHTNHIFDVDFKILLFWNKSLKSYSIITDRCDPDKELRDASMLAARCQFNISSDIWYQLLSITKRQKKTMLESEVWLVSTSDLKYKLINLNNKVYQDPQFITLQEACKLYTHMTSLTQLSIDRLLEIRGENIKH